MVVIGGDVDGGTFVVVVGGASVVVVGASVVDVGASVVVVGASVVVVGASVVVVGASVVVSGHLSGKDKQQSGSRSLKIQQQRGRMCSLATLYVLVLC